MNLRNSLRDKFTKNIDDEISIDEKKESKYKSVKPRYFLDSDHVILSQDIAQQIEEAIVKIEHYKKIYIEWGFSQVDPVGKGIVLNFHGEPGTGKTLTAEALAGRLQKNFLPVSIADIESKFMGETSKNIVEIFKVATEEKAILFFDEADTMLGKRLSSVTQGIDNEVNSMRSVLLIELEKFEGIAIFATNFFKNYDSAFVSRITHHIKFTLPDFSARERLWKRMLVNEIPLQDNREKLIPLLVELSEGLSGRDIRTVMRLALPKPLVTNLDYLTKDHITESIAQVKQNLNKNVQKDDFKKDQINVASKLLGINKE